MSLWEEKSLVLKFLQILIDPNDPSGVPVPYTAQFFFGPAGRQTAGGLILGLVSIGLLVAGVLAVLFLIVGGIRYIAAHGNEEQAESAKKTISHAIIGLVIVILSFVIVRVIANALIFGAA